MSEVAGLVERLSLKSDPESRDAASALQAQAEEIERLTRHVEALQSKIDPDRSCACSYDDPDHVCWVHSPKLREAVGFLRPIIDSARYESSAAYVVRIPDDTVHRARAFLATMEQTPKVEKPHE